MFNIIYYEKLFQKHVFILVFENMSIFQYFWFIFFKIRKKTTVLKILEKILYKIRNKIVFVINYIVFDKLIDFVFIKIISFQLFFDISVLEKSGFEYSLVK